MGGMSFRVRFMVRVRAWILGLLFFGILPALAETPPAPRDVKNAPAPAAGASGKPVTNLPAAGTGQVAPLGRVEVRAETVGSGLTRLSYAFPAPVAAAVFLRDGYLWAAFNLPNVIFSHQGVDISPAGRIQNAEHLPDGTVSIMRYKVRPGQAVAVQRSGATWQIDLKDNAALPVSPIEAGVQTEEASGDRIFMPVTDLGPRLELVDPAIGDRIVVVPVLAAGRGVSVRREFVEFDILATAQGVVIAPKSEGIAISRYRNGLMISKPDGLKLLRSRSRQLMAVRPEGLMDDKKGSDNAKAPVAGRLKLIDASAWRLGPPEMYTDNYHRLLANITAFKPTERNPARWELAKFFIGFGRAVDALGIMQLMAESNPDLLDDQEFRAVRGVANIMARRYSEAADDLSHPALAASPDGALWRAIADERLEKWDAALADYMKGVDVLTLYDQPERAKFELAAVRAAYQKNNVEFMSRELGLMSEYVLPLSEVSEIDYLKGRMYELAGDPSSAMTAYKKAVAGSERRIAAEASFALTELKLKNSQITISDAIDRLERLRFAWRGDQFELDLLGHLGQLYFKAGDHRSGFEAMRQAVSYFGKSPKTLGISEAMTAVFRNLFLEGGADQMPPVTALALYYDFRELTPLGADGDEMIRRLADRLVTVDLLDRAGELLEHQIKFRLEGVAQATVASRLAMIYIMDQKPEKALTIIRSTRQAIIPPDIEERRNRVEARALTDLKQFEEALVLIEKDKGHDADLLRADIYWGSGDWKNVVALENKLLGKRWEDAKPLEGDERRQILRVALAMSLGDDRDGLKVMRDHYLKLMAGGAYENAFSTITDRGAHDPAEVQSMTRDIAGVNTLEAFMNTYRKEFMDKKAAPLKK
jgi:tetratricopeptide (TPR) repeat protein